MKAIDTNVLVRYLVRDDPIQYRAAADFFDDLRAVRGAARIDAIVLCELVRVLRSSYEYSRSELAAVIEKVLSTDQLEVDDSDAAWLALVDFRSSKADFADCFVGRRNERYGCAVTVTFDDRLRSLTTFELLRRDSR